MSTSNTTSVALAGFMSCHCVWGGWRVRIFGQFRLVICLSSPPVRLNQEVCSSFLSVHKEGKQKTTGKEMHIFYGKKTLLNTYVHFCHINIIGISDELGLTI